MIIYMHTKIHAHKGTCAYTHTHREITNERELHVLFRNHGMRTKERERKSERVRGTKGGMEGKEREEAERKRQR